MALGLAKGRDILGKKENIVAIIGDGSLSGGEALEALSVA
ncbi:MAG: 1-deoxy-D-xylulose-5-phosphate synthase N-terminal domain-containing protein, partial [Spirochaetales bacterium]|nr:1-deoxy-D-xylulose-5-phosphate synthase N-terminal domain-containing protein [Spirochaetales bacterium]